MRFTSKPIAETNEAPLADDGRLEALIEKFARRDAPAKARDREGNACHVVSVILRDDPADAENKAREIVGLVHAQGDRVVGQEAVRLSTPDPRTYLGRGAAAAVAERAFAAGADMLVIDAELSPSQLRNLEDAAGLPICDREAVILNVFQAHAKTRRARIQVEVAHLEYLRPRIRGLGLDMDQQAGGMMKARGPGETASELLARRLDRRLSDLRRALEKLATAGATQRRRRADCARIALVGYTNAGKTSLMNALTDAGLSARDSPFETLDATSRSLTRHAGDVVVTDTVGFIRRLPERLMASFESTLAEVAEATLLVVVVDVSDREWPMHLDTTEDVLGRLGAGDIPRHYVFNKLDLIGEPLPPEVLRSVVGDHEGTMLSAHDGEAVDGLRRTLIERARGGRRVARLFVPYGAADLMGLVFKHCLVLATEPRRRGIRFTVEAEARLVERIKRASMKEGA